MEFIIILETPLFYTLLLLICDLYAGTHTIEIR
jgi:hypothetical protein